MVINYLNGEFLVSKDKHGKKSVRTSFHKELQKLYKELNINVDMSSFKMKQTEEELFKGHHEMMNIWQIAMEVDTYNLEIGKKYENLQNQFDIEVLPTSGSSLRDRLESAKREVSHV